MRTVARVALALLTTSLSARSDERPTAKQLLRSYEKTVGTMSRVKIQIVAKQYRKGDDDQRFKDNKDGLLETEEWTICRDNARWRISERSNALFTRQGKSREVRTGSEFLVGEQAVQVTALFPEAGETSPQLRLIAYLDGRAAEQRVHSHLAEIDRLFGFSPGDNRSPLWQVMGDASTLEVAPEMESIAGAKTYVVRSQGRFGMHTLWLDPANGHLPRRVEIVKHSGDTFNELQLGIATTLRNPPPGRDRPFPNAPAMHESRVRLENIRIETRSGVPVITAFDSIRAAVYDKGKTVESRTECRVRAISIPQEELPSTDFQSSIPIPNGTPVAVFDAPDGERANYLWMDGRVQKAATP